METGGDEVRALTAGLLALAMVACAPMARDGALSARLLEGDLHCGRDLPTASATWIDNPVHFEAAYRRFSRVSIETLVELPDVDFSRDGVLLVEMGQRGSGGYSVDLATERVSVQGHTARVTVHWTEPQPGAILPQVITSPCAFIVLARGDYRRIEVVDETGRLRAAADVP
jgi:hypothetical protein